MKKETYCKKGTHRLPVNSLGSYTVRELYLMLHELNGWRWPAEVFGPEPQWWTDTPKHDDCKRHWWQPKRETRDTLVHASQVVERLFPHLKWLKEEGLQERGNGQDEGGGVDDMV